MSDPTRGEIEATVTQPTYQVEYWNGSAWTAVADSAVLDVAGDNDAGGGMRATSVGGPGTGFHFDRLVTDDPIKPVDIYTARLGDHVRWFRETWQSRMRDPMRAAQIIIGAEA